MVYSVFSYEHTLSMVLATGYLHLICFGQQINQIYLHAKRFMKLSCLPSCTGLLNYDQSENVSKSDLYLNRSLYDTYIIYIYYILHIIYIYIYILYDTYIYILQCKNTLV